jgi:hypothetical protein
MSRQIVRCEFVIDDEDLEDLCLNFLSLASGASLTITEVAMGGY